MKYPNIVIIDDHSLFLQGIHGIISAGFPDSQISCYNSIASCEKELTNFEDIHLIISDIELPGEDIFPFLSKTKGLYPTLPIMVLTMHKKLSVIRKCKELDISGYLLKDDDELLHEAINNVLRGKCYYSPRVDKLYRSYAEQLNTISPREEEIIKLISQGLSNKEISEQLFVSVETVKTHKKNIKSKLGISGLSELIQYAHDNYLL